MLKPTADLADLRDCERAQDVVCEEMEEEWTADGMLLIISRQDTLLSSINNSFRTIFILGVDKAWSGSVKARAYHSVKQS